jgi:hypothetical protein
MISAFGAFTFGAFIPLPNVHKFIHSYTPIYFADFIRITTSPQSLPIFSAGKFLQIQDFKKGSRGTDFVIYQLKNQMLSYEENAMAFSLLFQAAQRKPCADDII